MLLFSVTIQVSRSALSQARRLLPGDQCFTPVPQRFRFASAVWVLLWFFPGWCALFAPTLRDRPESLRFPGPMIPVIDNTVNEE
jgi:hypothetical protein